MQNTATRHVALFIDGDNASLNHTEHIINLSKKYGLLKISRVYGDWTKPPLENWTVKLRPLDIRIIQQRRHTNSKNMTDIRMTMDIIELFLTGELDTFIIVSSDSDFTPICDRLISEGKQVIGIGSEQNSSEQFRKKCDRFIFFESFNKPTPATPEKPVQQTPAPQVIQEGVPPALASLVQRAVKEAGKSPDGWIHIGQVGNVLRQLEPQFESKYGSKKLSNLIKEVDGSFEIKGHLARKPTTQKETTPSQKQQKLMDQAFQQTREADGRAKLANLGTKLRELDPHFQSRFAGKKLSDWYKSYPQKYHVSQNHVRMC